MLEQFDYAEEIHELHGKPSVVIPGVLPPTPNPDNTTCSYVCGLRALTHFVPANGLTLSDFCRFAGKEEGKFGYTPAINLFLSDGFGLSSVVIDAFDFQEFRQSSGRYLLEFQEGNASEQEMSNPEMTPMLEVTSAFLDSDRILVHQRVPKLQDLYNLINDGFLPICSVNSRQLHGKALPGESPVSHAVLVYGVDTESNSVLLHDPGSVSTNDPNRTLPPVSGWSVPMEDFLKAWGDEKMRGIYAIGPRYNDELNLDV